MKKLISIICCVMALALCLTACGQSAASHEAGQSLAKGGVLVLSINPEIAVEYDENGTVTGVTARNDDALGIINSCTGLIGQPTREVVTDLVTAIGEAGYFVEEIEGQRRQITLEIEPGSFLPNGAFLDDVIEDIREVVSIHDWTTPLVVEGESDFGITDYIDTDYGIDNDGITDYNGGSAYGAITDYDDTDYGPNSDGVTDYDDTDYGPNHDGVTDYSDYGTTNSGNTNYGNFGYKTPAATTPPATTPPVSSDSTDYGDSVYGDSIYGDSGYEAPAATTPPATTPPVSSGNTDYGDSVYGDSIYGDSGYKAPAATNPPANYGDSGYSNYEADSGYSDYEGES